MKTEEKLLYCALKLFAKRGFGAVSVRDISSEVGVRESAMYKHYKNKEALFDKIINLTMLRIQEFQESLKIINKTSIKETLASIFESIVEFYLTDEIVCNFKQMMLIEKCRSEKMRMMFEEMFVHKSLDYYEQIFSSLQFVNAKILAIQFYSPLFMLLFGYGCELKEAKLLIKQHVEQFFTINKIED